MVPMVSYDQKSDVTPDFDCLAMLMRMALHDQKVVLHLILMVLTY